MVRANLSKDVGEDTQTLENIVCVAGWKDDINNHLIIIATTNIFLSFLAFLGNTLILVALSKESSLHPPAKLLYRCLAITDLCVGLISEPSSVVYWLSLVREDWKLCHHALKMSFLSYLYSFFSFSLIDDRTKCGQTSRLVAEAKIQARCNSETNLRNCCHHLGFFDNRWDIAFSKLPRSRLV